MSETETNVIVPAAPEADVKLSFDPNNFAADMQKLATASGMTIETPQEPIAIPQPTQPAQPEQAAITKPEEATHTEVAVPEKFKTADGKVDKEKLNKSMANVDETLALYLAKEKELKRKMNEVKAQENAYLTPPVTKAPIPEAPINTNFAAQLEADVARDGFGVVAAKLFTAAQQSAVEQLKGEIDSLKGVNAENTTKQQIEAIGKHDPWVYTPEGLATLTRTLEEQPYLWQAADPYKAAYLYNNGLKNVAASRSNSQVLTPTPTARPSAPVPTGQAANRTSAPVLKLDTKEAIDNHLKGLTPAQQSEFFKKAGLPGF